MELLLLDFQLSVCKIRELAAVDWHGAFTSLTGTADELSLVCESRLVPAGLDAVEPGWRALRVAGTLDFNAVGVLKGLSGTLANENISVFVVSTYDTDYILIKEKDLSTSLTALKKSGYTVETA